MARYENEDFCSCNSLQNPGLLEFETTDEVIELNNRTWEKLQGVIPAMVYKPGKTIYAGGHITALLLTQGEFSLEIMDILKNMVNVDDTTKVLLEEVVSPEEVTGDIIKENDNFKVGLTKTSETTAEIIISKK